MATCKPTDLSATERQTPGRGYPIEKYLSHDVTVLPADRHGLAQLFEVMSEVLVALQAKSDTCKQYLAREEAAALLRIDVKTFDDWRDAGVLVEGRHYIRVNRIIRVHPNFIELIFEDRMVLAMQNAKANQPTQSLVSAPQKESQAKLARSGNGSGQPRKAPFAPGFWMDSL